jgi:hypothetical protein
MLLRDHPFMSHHRVPNWPPSWTWVGGIENIQPKGEIGILKAVAVSNLKTANRCFLYIEYEGSSYIGRLLFDDYSVCRHIAKLLQGCCNRSIAEIGDLDLSHTLGASESMETKKCPVLVVDRPCGLELFHVSTEEPTADSPPLELWECVRGHRMHFVSKKEESKSEAENS